MKVAIIGANGKSGSNLVQEALKQGHDVTATLRNEEYKNVDVKVVYKDVFELSKADLEGFRRYQRICGMDARSVPAS